MTSHVKVSLWRQAATAVLTAECSQNNKGQSHIRHNADWFLFSKHSKHATLSTAFANVTQPSAVCKMSQKMLSEFGFQQSKTSSKQTKDGQSMTENKMVNAQGPSKEPSMTVHSQK